MPAHANAQALHDLENGANGLTLIFAGANGAYGFGLEPSAEAIEKVLDGIFIDAGISIELQIGPQSRMAAIHVAEYVKRKGLDRLPPAISASVSIRSAPARSGDPVPMPGPRSCPRSPAGSKASRRWASRARSRPPTDG